MKTEHRYYTVKALIDISSSVNKISKSIVDRLGRKYGNHYKNKKVKNSLGTIDCLDLSFRYKGKDRLLADSDKTFNDFEIIKKPCKAPYSCADLVLDLPWLRLRDAKIDIWKEGIKIYGNFVPFCKGPNNDEFFYNSNSNAESSKSDLTKLRKKVKKLERTVDWIGNYVEEQTDSSNSDYAPPEKKAKPRRNLVRAVQSN